MECDQRRTKTELGLRDYNDGKESERTKHAQSLNICTRYDDARESSERWENATDLSRCMGKVRKTTKTGSNDEMAWGKKVHHRPYEKKIISYI